MSKQAERRISTRNIPEAQLLSILQAKGLACNMGSCAEDILYMFVDVKNRSGGGALLQLPFQLVENTVFNLSVADRSGGKWTTRPARVVWTRKSENGHYHSGVQFMDATNVCLPADEMEADPSKPRPADLHFLMNASFFQAISDQGLCLLLNTLQRTTFQPGERIISQGGSGECLYLIQEGTCIVHAGKEDAPDHVIRLKDGDVIGEMAVLTGEPRTANVDAETDMVLWRLDRVDFEALAGRHPELRLFLTEIMSNRFDGSLFVGDRTVGKYVLTGKIGTGGWGIVYRGIHKILKIPVAIKMMKHDMAMESSFLDTFRQEAKLIARMSHPNIVRVYDVEEIYKTIFIIMEYLEGNSLKEYMKKSGPMPAALCAGILAQVCDGLDCAHGIDIIHRDIKPENIFLLEGDRVKLLDFGLACVPGTEDMDIRGTVHYAPPEQIDGWPVDARSDIYSMGVMAYEMVTGSKPYPGRSLAEIMDLHCSRDLPDPAVLVPDMPGALRDFIMTCGRCKPEERFQSVREAREALPAVSPQEELGRAVTSLVLVHPQHQQQELKKLLEEFGNKAAELGVELMMSEFRNV